MCVITTGRIEKAKVLNAWDAKSSVMLLSDPVQDVIVDMFAIESNIYAAYEVDDGIVIYSSVYYRFVGPSLREFCFGHEMFPEQVAPYCVYLVETNEIVKPPVRQTEITKVTLRSNRININVELSRTYTLGELIELLQPSAASASIIAPGHLLLEY